MKKKLKRYERRRGLKISKSIKISPELNAEYTAACARYIKLTGQELVFSRWGEEKVREFIKEINAVCDDLENGTEDGKEGGKEDGDSE